MKHLPVPEIVRSGFDSSFDPPLSVLCIQWSPTLSEITRNWSLPDGVSFRSGLPSRFGYSIQRSSADFFSVTILWDRMKLHWNHLDRHDLMECDLGMILTAIGVDLWNLLDSLTDSEELLIPRAA